jgi:aryl-alcohol dehydrogenase-like predicted oxidoreductase
LGEELLWKALGSGVDEIVVATKVGYDFYSSRDRPVRRYDEEYLRFAVSMSVKRLGKRPVDLLQLHNPPLEVLGGEEVYRVARRLVREGLINHFGIALGPEVDVLPHALKALEHEEVEVLQFVYNALEQEPGRTIAREARKLGVGVIVRVPHAGGVLDESISPGDVGKLGDHRSLRRKGWYEWAFKVYGAMREKLASLPGAPSQKALKFIQQSINPDTIVVIAKSREKLAEYVGFTEIEDLPEEDVHYITRVYYENIKWSPEAPKHVAGSGEK